jgi:Mor family transcriptional regulator
MANKPGDALSKFRRNREIIRRYDNGEEAHNLATIYSLTERRIFQILSEPNRLMMDEWGREASFIGMK